MRLLFTEKRISREEIIDHPSLDEGFGTDLEEYPFMRVYFREEET